MVVYDWKILVAERINTPTIKTRISDYEKEYLGSDKVILYVLPLN
jgi:hypothetical protein